MRLKLLFLRSLYDWMTATWSLYSTNFLEFLVLLNFSS